MSFIRFCQVGYSRNATDTVLLRIAKAGVIVNIDLLNNFRWGLNLTHFEYTGINQDENAEFERAAGDPLHE
jgi:hypothetical protein